MRLKQTYCLAVTEYQLDPNFDHSVDINCSAAYGQCFYDCESGYTRCPGQYGCFSACSPQPTGGTRRARSHVGKVDRRSHPILLDASSPEFPTGMKPSIIDDSSAFCPSGLKACRVPSTSARHAELAIECIDPQSDLRACGGCVAPGSPGVDCTDLEGAVHTACNEGKCSICECTSFTLSLYSVPNLRPSAKCAKRYRRVKDLAGADMCVRSG